MDEDTSLTKPGRRPGLSGLPMLTKAQRIVAKKYSPFRDPEPPNFLKYGRPRQPPTVRIYRKTVGDVIYEWRGYIPVGVGNYCPDEIEEVRIW